MDDLAVLERQLGRLDEEADDMDVGTRNRIEAAGRSLNRRVLAPLSAWQTMLHALNETRPEPGERPDEILFLRLARAEGVADGVDLEDRAGRAGGHAAALRPAKRLRAKTPNRPSQPARDSAASAAPRRERLRSWCRARKVLDNCTQPTCLTVDALARCIL